MRKYLFFASAIAGLFFLLTSESNYSSGSPGGKTGSPGDNGATCTECHGGTATLQEGWITTNIPGEGYTPGSTYTITATGTHAGVVKFGFEATSENSSAAKVGTIVVTNSTQTQLANNNKSITHKSAGTTPSGNSKTWTFDWIAPAEGTGNVTFYAAFNAANGNGNNSGDVIYRSFLSVPEAPSINPGITVHFSGMNPHIGQLLEARLIDKATRMETERTAIDEIPGAEFEIHFGNAIDGHSYWIDFYADHNDNGYYDGIPTDHAWRIVVNDFNVSASAEFVHNTNFSEIFWKHMYELEFSGMTPHIGQKLEVRMIEQNTMKEAGRTTLNAIPAAQFSVFLPFLVSGVDYYVDFYADMNGNGIYNAPPADHAWRMELTEVEGDEDDNFVHNTNFTNIGWNYRFTLHAMAMNPHLGQLFELRLVNQATLQEAGRVSLDSVVMADFDAGTVGLDLGEDYFVDFYADHNGNGVYDPPPADHAWRLNLNDVSGDSELDFTHNTNFTNIQWPLTGIDARIFNDVISIYPNPTSGSLAISAEQAEFRVNSIRLLNSGGRVVHSVTSYQSGEMVRLSLDDMEAGLYYVVITLDNGSVMTKPVIKL